VEDNTSVRRATCRFLTQYGYGVFEAVDGTEALRFCQQHEGEIHAVITDVVMPHMGGRELADHLAVVRPQTAVLFVSGYTDSRPLRERPAESTIALLQKPFTAETLARKVRELLDTAP
jgi:CheY-like chemotaxis protein